MLIDHIIYAAPDLEIAVADMESRFGVRPSGGGKHTGQGTHNKLLPLAQERISRLSPLILSNPSHAVPVPTELTALPTAAWWAGPLNAMTSRQRSNTLASRVLTKATCWKATELRPQAPSCDGALRAMR
jgi:hypothetical protein